MTKFRLQGNMWNFENGRKKLNCSLVIILLKLNILNTCGIGSQMPKDNFSPFFLVEVADFESS